MVTDKNHIIPTSLRKKACCDRHSSLVTIELFLVAIELYLNYQSHARNRREWLVRDGVFIERRFGIKMQFGFIKQHIYNVHALELNVM